jgi:hypothetical protein
MPQPVVDDQIFTTKAVTVSPIGLPLRLSPKAPLVCAQ